MKLLIGLGNPGREYEHTRHNAGFDVMSLVSARADIQLLSCVTFAVFRHQASTALWNTFLPFLSLTPSLSCSSVTA